MALGTGLYFLLRLALDRRTGRALLAPLVVAGGAWVLALLVCSVQIMPFFEYLLNSYSIVDRPVRMMEEPAWMPATGVASFFVPRFFGTKMEQNFWGKWNSNFTGMLYMGIAVWAAVALLSVGKGRSRAERHRVLSLSLVTGFFILATFNFPVIRWIHRLPLFNTIYQCYHIAFPVFAIPMLGAIGLDRWFEGRRNLRDLARPALWILCAGTLVVFIYWFNSGLIRAMGMRSYILGYMAAAGSAAFLCLAILSAYVVLPKPRIAAGLFTLLLAADLLSAVHGILTTCPRDELFFDTKLTRFLQQLPQPCRVGVAMSAIPAGIMPHYGIEQWTGYDGIYPARMLHFQRELGPDIWNAMEPACSIAYYLHDLRTDPMFPADRPGYFEAVGEFEGIEVYRNLKAFPRAYLVGKARVVEETPVLFDLMRSASFDPATEALIEKPLPAPLPDDASRDLGKAVVTKRDATYVAVEAEALQTAILVLADAYFPGWTASVDGDEVPIFPVNYAFRGLILPKGKHIIEYRYDPLSVRVGLVLSTLSLFAGAVLAVAAWIWRR